jgi:hypothetical protein
MTLETLDKIVGGVTLFFVVLFLAMAAFVCSARAAGEACTSVRNYDRRQACFAEARGQPDQCTSIRSQDQRTVCRVQAKMRRER